MARTFVVTVPKVKVFSRRGIERHGEVKRLFVHETAYVTQILKCFDLENSNSVSVPANPNVKLYSANENALVIAKFPFREAAGLLSFLYFTVGGVSKYLNSYDENHCQAIIHIIKYVQGTKDFDILTESEDNTIIFKYRDSDYVEHTETRPSTSVLFFCYLSSVIWSPERQKMMRLDTIEAKYVAYSITVEDTTWLQSLLCDFGMQCDQATKKRRG
ncbi:uncharacterized protein LOC126481876 [Schistocerca serialis cubense]|uniref:uncharacterized protein LOC126481876 n=1 Tax=Schistocerca serialis cubense TaxID=2023355 RepID=UPI00214E5225|nr:uncharacterized protein LOC126481876 [Schistocerca serialis cubense]